MHFKKTEKIINDMLSDGLMPGVSYAIIDHDQINKRIMGLAEITPNKVKLTDQLQYDLASLTKVVGTVPVIMKLIEEQKLNLFDPIQKYLPEWQDSQVKIINLITHTSDIVGYIENRNKLAPNDLRKALLNLKVGKNFAKQIKYQDVNFIFLGWIAEKILGISIQKAITDIVINPLGLKHTTFTPSKINSVPTEITNDRGLIRGEVHDPKTYILGEHSGAAGLFSTLDDLIIFSQWIMGQVFNDQVVSSKFLNELFVDQTPMKSKNRSLGWDLRYNFKNVPYIVHTGFTGTILIISRELKRSLIFLSNRVHPEPNQEFLIRRQILIDTFINEK
ncbi:serine hydrolase domain-containing protein [Lentilactobacillus laojiaonis]|uniref:serine hydrolase domain-containing protein n=1 Tax=Lentilactobacillus laojiaonis TaxID=2883998 RepID=UPI001D0BE095|nr:serine hydrolase domain-containing protein [Lentilactobacillus laojiaonis]UDM31770.1 beta-lactamase family protein [Lentilactobacillus laojiaonis]